MTPTLIAFALLGLACVATIVVGLPGGWFLIALASAIELLDANWLGEGAETFGWSWIAAGLGLAVFGEVLDLASGALGAKGGGGTREGTIGALGGGFLGALGGTFVMPIPVIGTLAGVLLGTFLGAVAGELRAAPDKTPREVVRPAVAATLGRVLGLFAKTGVALLIWGGLLAAAVWG